MRSLIKSQIVIIGSGGHSRMIIECAQCLKYKVKYIIDISKKKNVEEKILNIPVKNLVYLKKIKKKTKVFLAIGDNIRRAKFYNKYKLYYNFINLIHPSSYVAKNITIGKANFIAPKAVVNSLGKIGNNSIINSGSIIEHEVKIGRFSHIGPNATVCGDSTIGENVFIGANAVIKQGVKIGDNAIVGAGSVVLNNIPVSATYVGNPAEKIK